MHKLLWLSILIAASAIAEDLYQYTDSAGNLVISNKKTPQSIKFCSAINEAARHKILNEELQHEKLALFQSQKLQPSDLYAEDIALHQRNIDVLTKQLNEEQTIN